MRFACRTILDRPEHFCREAILLDDNAKVLLHLRVPVDSIIAWRVGFEQMLSSQEGRQRCAELLKHAHSLQACQVDEGTPKATFWRVCYALRDSLTQLPVGETMGVLATLDKWMGRLFAVHAIYETEQSSYRFGVIVAGNLVLDGRRPLSVLSPEETLQSAIHKDWWKATIAHIQNPQALFTLLTHYDLIAGTVQKQINGHHSNRRFLLSSFNNLTKALVDILERSTEMTEFRDRIGDLCTLIVANELDDLEEQKFYLEYLLNSKESTVGREQRLQMIVHTILKNLKTKTASPQTTGNKIDHDVLGIVGAISSYYLHQNEFRRAIGYWRTTQAYTRIPQALLMLYERPGPITFAAGLLLILITGLALSAQALHQNSWQYRLAESLIAMLILAVLTITFSAIAVVIYRLGTHQGLDYMELLLPRMFGAIMVGLTILLFQDTAWQIALHMPVFNLLAVCLLVYVLSFLYIFLDVYKTIRLLPMAADEDISSVRRALNRSWQIFVIGLLEALFATLISTTLFATSVMNSDLQRYGVVIGVPGLATLGIFPSLIVLWAGLALFIGAFVQLFWQDRQITSPL